MVQLSHPTSIFPLRNLLFLCCFCSCCFHFVVHSQLITAATLQNDGRLTKFVNQLDRYGISPSIGTTIFAPSNDAFDRFESDDLVRWSKYTQQAEFFVHARDLQLWHLITEGRYTVSEIFDGQRQSLTNPLGSMVISQQFRSLDNVVLQDTDIVEADIPTSQGIIHVIDKIILPPYLGMNMIQNLLQDRHFDFAFTTMANIALWAELDEELNKVYENGLTFLVPPNRRFNRAEINVPLLLTEPMREYTRDFVLCHMIKRNYYEAGIIAYNQENNQQQFLETTMLGTHIWITTTDDQVRFQSTEVRLFDQPTEHGIFHGIDFPLKPPFASDFAEFTHMSTDIDTSVCFRFFTQALLSSGDISEMFNTSVTLWCPTGEAFGFFNNEDRDRLLEPIWVRHATEFLLNHMSGPARTRREWVNMAPGYIEMLNGATYELRKSGSRPRIRTQTEQARSDFGDLISVDGYVHILDTVLTPTAVSRSVYDQSNLDPDFSLVVENIDFVDLTNYVDQDLPLTFFAPNNEAFRRVQIGIFDSDEVILRHLFRGLLFTDVIANETRLTSVNGVTLAVERRGEFNESLYVGGAYIYQGDILARNGVLHHVDRVIGIEYPTSMPTVSPAPTITARPTAYVPPTPAPVPTVVNGPVTIVFPPINPPTNPAPAPKNNNNVQGTSAASPRFPSTFPCLGMPSSIICIILLVTSSLMFLI